MERFDLLLSEDLKEDFSSFSSSDECLDVSQVFCYGPAGSFNRNPVPRISSTPVVAYPYNPLRSKHKRAIVVLSGQPMFYELKHLQKVPFFCKPSIWEDNTRDSPYLRCNLHKLGLSATHLALKALLECADGRLDPKTKACTIHGMMEIAREISFTVPPRPLEHFFRTVRVTQSLVETVNAILGCLYNQNPRTVRLFEQLRKYGANRKVLTKTEEEALLFDTRHTAIEVALYSQHSVTTDRTVQKFIEAVTVATNLSGVEAAVPQMRALWREIIHDRFAWQLSSLWTCLFDVLQAHSEHDYRKLAVSFHEFVTSRLARDVVVKVLVYGEELTDHFPSHVKADGLRALVSACMRDSTRQQLQWIRSQCAAFRDSWKRHFGLHFQEFCLLRSEVHTEIFQVSVRDVVFVVAFWESLTPESLIRRALCKQIQCFAVKHLKKSPFHRIPRSYCDIVGKEFCERRLQLNWKFACEEEFFGEIPAVFESETTKKEEEGETEAFATLGHYDVL